MKFNTNTITTAMLALVLICFFFPFAEISCNNVSYLKLSGKDLLRGKEMTKADVMAFAKKAGLEKEVSEYTDPQQETKNIPSNPWAIIAFSMAAIGVLTGVVLRRFGTVIHLVTSAAAVISLIGLQLSMNSEYSYTNSLFKVELNIKYLAGYWLSLLLSGLVAGICLVVFLIERKKINQPINIPSENIKSEPPPTDTPVE
jgi:hypothetical protein